MLLNRNDTSGSRGLERRLQYPSGAQCRHEYIQKKGTTKPGPAKEIVVRVEGSGVIEIYLDPRPVPPNSRVTSHFPDCINPTRLPDKSRHFLRRRRNLVPRARREPPFGTIHDPPTLQYVRQREVIRRRLLVSMPPFAHSLSAEAGLDRLQHRDTTEHRGWEPLRHVGTRAHAAPSPRSASRRPAPPWQRCGERIQQRRRHAGRNQELAARGLDCRHLRRFQHRAGADRQLREDRSPDRGRSRRSRISVLRSVRLDRGQPAVGEGAVQDRGPLGRTVSTHSTPAARSSASARDWVSARPFISKIPRIRSAERVAAAKWKTASFRLQRFALTLRTNGKHLPRRPWRRVRRGERGAVVAEQVFGIAFRAHRAGRIWAGCRNRQGATVGGRRQRATICSARTPGCGLMPLAGGVASTRGRAAPPFRGGDQHFQRPASLSMRIACRRAVSLNGPHARGFPGDVGSRRGSCLMRWTGGCR